MSIPKATNVRLPRIKAGLMQGDTYTQIGTKCGVTLKTIYRDVQIWSQTPDFDEWLDAEWVRLKTKAEQEDFMEVFRQLTKLKAKRTTQKFESKHVEEITQKIKLDISVYNDAEKSILDRAARLLDRKSKGKPASIH